jgi:hypothetical protein
MKTEQLGTKQEIIEEVAEKLKSKELFNESNDRARKILSEIKSLPTQERMYSEEEMLKILHKFGFDYTYNYKGEKTIYEWIPEWFEEYKRLLTI